MRAVLPILIMAFVVGSGAFLLLDPLSDRNAAYRAENEALLQLLSHPQGASVVSSEQNAYYDEGFSSLLNRARGWTLNVTYRAPAGASADDISAFYESHAPAGWKKVESATIKSVDTAGNPGPTHRNIFFSDGRRRVSINVDNMLQGGPGTYEVVVDYKGGSTAPSA